VKLAAKYADARANQPNEGAGNGHGSYLEGTLIITHKSGKYWRIRVRTYCLGATIRTTSGKFSNWRKAENDDRYWRLTVSERRAAPLASQQANTFSLSGGYIHVDFSTTSINGQPRLIYQDPVRNLSFAGSESQSRCAGYWQHCERHAGYNRGRRVDNLQRVYTECDRPWSGRIRSGNNRRRDDNS